MWAVVQQGISTLDFDYVDYARFALRSPAPQRVAPGLRPAARRRRAPEPPEMPREEPSPGRHRRRRGGRSEHRVAPRRARLHRRARASNAPSPRAAARSTRPASSGSSAASLPLTRMMMHSVDVYRRARSRSRPRPGARRAGARSARCASRRPSRAWRSCGASTVGPRRSASRWSWSRAAKRTSCFPLMDPTGVLGAVWLPTDGYLDPSGLTHAFLGGAQDARRHRRGGHAGHRPRRRAAAASRRS